MCTASLPVHSTNEDSHWANLNQRGNSHSPPHCDTEGHVTGSLSEARRRLVAPILAFHHITSCCVRDTRSLLWELVTVEEKMGKIVQRRVF